MGRERGPKKFSFPLPRRSRTKVEDVHKNDDLRSLPSTTSVQDWPSRHEESSSKAHRVLGTSDALYRSTSGQLSIPASPGFMSITVSEASFGSQIDDRNSAGTATDNGAYPKRPDMSKRPSSNILGRTYTRGSRHGSDNSSVTRQLQPQTSNSTLRSHYDAKSSPLSISQQTSDSAVRDRALRRGYPPVLTDDGYSGREASPVSPIIQEETRQKEFRKSKPARLDLSKLFPKPRGAEGQHYGNALLSPTKMVNSPAAMSMTSEYFPRPMTREPTPQIEGHTRLQKAPKHRESTIRSPKSPVRKYQRDEYDNAKVHVRRPPRGVQHWFDALDEDSDESPEETQHVYAPKALRPIVTAPVRGPVGSQSSREQLTSHYEPQSQASTPAYRKDTFAIEDIVDITHLTSPSQFSVDTPQPQASFKHRESALSKNNRKDNSVLSFSSSEDEVDGDPSRARRVAVRKSLDVADYSDEIVIGQAQVYEVRPHHRKQQSSGRMSTLSTSTNAATIEVMYTPEPPFSSYHYPRSSMHSGSRRSSHARQPSVIHEVEDSRPKIAVNMPLSPTARSVWSARTSASAPQAQSPSDGAHKLMEVTAEEEALLEMMRKKRAAMNKQSTPPKVETLAQEHDQRLKTPLESTRRTSGFLSMSLESSPVRVVEARTRQRSPAVPSPLLLPLRGRSGSKADCEGNVVMSQLRDSSASETWSDRHHSPPSRGRLPHYLPTPSIFSPLDLFPPSSPTPAASVASPTTTDHPSPLPSPITPGYSMGEKDVLVQVARSDTSNEIEDLSLLDNGVIGIPSESNSKPDHTHRRRRTASSDAEINFPAPPSSTSFRDLSSVSEASSSRPPSIVEPPVPRLPRKIPRHISELALSAGQSRSRQSSVHSTGSRTSNYSVASSYLTGNGGDTRRSKHLSPADGVFGRRMGCEERDSVSGDVLAAWGSLGGTY
jgi:hypothetical protein